MGCLYQMRAWQRTSTDKWQKGGTAFDQGYTKLDY